MRGAQRDHTVDRQPEIGPVDNGVDGDQRWINIIADIEWNMITLAFHHYEGNTAGYAQQTHEQIGRDKVENLEIEAGLAGRVRPRNDQNDNVADTTKKTDG